MNYTVIVHFKKPPVTEKFPMLTRDEAMGIRNIFENLKDVGVVRIERIY